MGIASRSQAAPFSGKYLTATPESDAVLEEGEYFHYQLIGMRVRTEEGEELGEIREILETGSNDVYIVGGAQGELLIPATAHVVLDVDVAAGAMLVRLPDVCADNPALTRYWADAKIGLISCETGR